MRIHLEPQPGTVEGSTTPRWHDVLDAIRTQAPGHHLIEHVAELPNTTGVVLFFEHIPQDGVAAARTAVHDALLAAGIHGWQVRACAIDQHDAPPTDAGPW